MVFGEWQQVFRYRLENDKGYQLSVMAYKTIEYDAWIKEDQKYSILFFSF